MDSSYVAPRLYEKESAEEVADDDDTTLGVISDCSLKESILCALICAVLAISIASAIVVFKNFLNIF